MQVNDMIQILQHGSGAQVVQRYQGETKALSQLAADELERLAPQDGYVESPPLRNPLVASCWAMLHREVQAVAIGSDGTVRLYWAPGTSEEDRATLERCLMRYCLK